MKMASEPLEHFGTLCIRNEPDIVGDCEACGGAIYDYEFAQCDCGKSVHTGCIKECSQCGNTACIKCMIKDDNSDEWFCQTDPGESDCRDIYNEQM